MTARLVALALMLIPVAAAAQTPTDVRTVLVEELRGKECRMDANALGQMLEVVFGMDSATAALNLATLGVDKVIAWEGRDVVLLEPHCGGTEGGPRGLKADMVAAIRGNGCAVSATDGPVVGGVDFNTEAAGAIARAMIATGEAVLEPDALRLSPELCGTDGQ